MENEKCFIFHNVPFLMFPLVLCFTMFHFVTKILCLNETAEKWNIKKFKILHFQHGFIL